MSNVLCNLISFHLSIYLSVSFCLFFSRSIQINFLFMKIFSLIESFAEVQFSRFQFLCIREWKRTKKKRKQRVIGTSLSWIIIRKLYQSIVVSCQCTYIYMCFLFSFLSFLLNCFWRSSKWSSWSKKALYHPNINISVHFVVLYLVYGEKINEIVYEWYKINARITS